MLVIVLVLVLVLVLLLVSVREGERGEIKGVGEGGKGCGAVGWDEDKVADREVCCRFNRSGSVRHAMCSAVLSRRSRVEKSREERSRMQ